MSSAHWQNMRHSKLFSKEVGDQEFGTVSTPFSRPTRDPGWEFSLGGDFFPPSNFDRRVGEISPPPSKFHRRVGEISSPPCRYPPHSPFQILIF